MQADARCDRRDAAANNALHHAVLGWEAERGEGYASIARELLLACCDPEVGRRFDLRPSGSFL